jgi:teichuronic acid biosynthesis glycosyltransferase TuaC
MKILIVCSGNAPGFVFEKHQAFIHDQVEAVRRQYDQVEFDYFLITRKGIRGYLSCLKHLYKQLSHGNYTCIHAHVATAGLLANLQRGTPVVTTFHGSDINGKGHRVLSAVVELLSRRTIYVSDGLRRKALIRLGARSRVIPCGVDFALFAPGDKEVARKQLGLSEQKKYILFASGFGNLVKNYPLAKAAVDRLRDWEVELLELKDYTREEVARLLVAVDAALLTSFSEGSPQFVKEALACNCPVVSTDVGDVRAVINEVEGCYLTSFEVGDVARKLALVLQSTEKIRGRERIGHFDNRLIAQQVLAVYHSIIDK